jgi:hypothetical protein
MFLLDPDVHSCRWTPILCTHFIPPSIFPHRLSMKMTLSYELELVTLLLCDSSVFYLGVIIVSCSSILSFLPFLDDTQARELEFYILLSHY